MKYIFLLFTFIIISNIQIKAQSEIAYNMDSIVVTANRVPVSFSETGRTIDVITQREIEQLPVTNIQDLLEHVSGIDIKQRGPEGVQADVSIRGGNFEQSLILIDGIKLVDPQTGHHNMNLPVSFSQLERVEILKGQGSRIYGANAFSGVINLITKKSGVNNIQAELNGGENNYFKLGLNSAINLGNTFHNISFSKTKSDGYRFNTGFDNYNFSINNSFRFSNTVLNTIYGYTDKNFGANSFYTTRFPNQAEKTKTNFAAISADINLSEFSLLPKIFWRKNDDEFVLNKSNPAFYKNNHTTNVYGGELQATTNVLGGTTSFGFEYSQDKIESNNLGEHSRIKQGFFAEQLIRISQQLNFSIGGFAHNYSNFGWNFWPGFDLSYSPINSLKLFANYGRAFRIPTYTELYYNDPVTLGNANLKQEESTNYEIGVNYLWESVKVNSTIFRKEGTNLIDWVLNESNAIWIADNITKVNTTGFELGLNFILDDNDFYGIFSQLNIDYTYLNSDKIQTEFLSRYVLEHLRHDLSISLFNNLPFEINQSWTFNYEDRVSLKDHYTIDTKLMKQFSNFNVFIMASNLLNKSYEEIPGVPLPGRWIIGGVRLNIL